MFQMHTSGDKRSALSGFLTGMCLVMLALSQGCAGAQHVQRTAKGGELALRGPYMFAMGEARAKMAEHCGGPYQLHDTSDGLRYECLAN